MCVSVCRIHQSEWIYSIFLFVSLCTCVPWVQFSRIGAQGFLQNQDKGKGWVSLKCALLLQPCPLYPLTSSPPPAAPSTTASCAWPLPFHQITWLLILLTHCDVVKTTALRGLRNRGSWNAQSRQGTYSTTTNSWADHLSNLQYRCPVSHAVPIAKAAIIVAKWN